MPIEQTMPNEIHIPTTTELLARSFPIPNLGRTVKVEPKATDLSPTSVAPGFFSMTDLEKASTRLDAIRGIFHK
jgi:hypothetical protein